MTDARQFNVTDPEGRLLCPACGFPDYAGRPAYDDKEGLIGTTICPCCSWEPGFDDNPAASAAAQDTILGSLRAYRAAWNGGDTPQWRGRLAERPAQWCPKEQLERLFQTAPNVR